MSFSLLVCENRFASNFQIDFLFVFDATRTVVNALLASDPISGLSGEAKRVSCDTSETSETPETSGTPEEKSEKQSTRERSLAANRGRKNFAWLFRRDAAIITGVLGVVFPGSRENNSFVDAKMVIEEQTIVYDKTNITRTVSNFGFFKFFLIF